MDGNNVERYLFWNFDILPVQKTNWFPFFYADMNKPIKKIILILLIVLFLPVIFFSIREMTSLSRDEAIIEEIYSSQLQSILFSINQYSDDIVRSWNSQLNSIMESNGSEDELKKELSVFFSESQSVQSLYISDSLFQSELYAEYKGGNINLADGSKYLKELIKNNFIQLSRLYRYSESGFLKIES